MPCITIDLPHRPKTTTTTTTNPPNPNTPHVEKPHPDPPSTSTTPTPTTTSKPKTTTHPPPATLLTLLGLLILYAVLVSSTSNAVHAHHIPTDAATPPQLPQPQFQPQNDPFLWEFPKLDLAEEEFLVKRRGEEGTGDVDERQEGPAVTVTVTRTVVEVAVQTVVVQ